MTPPVNDEPIEIGTRYYSSLEAVLRDASLSPTVTAWCIDRIRRGERAMELLRKFDSDPAPSTADARLQFWALRDEVHAFLQSQLSVNP